MQTQMLILIHPLIHGIGALKNMIIIQSLKYSIKMCIFFNTFTNWPNTDKDMIPF